MQVRPGFHLHSVLGNDFLVPMGEDNVDFSELISLNETSLLLWQRMAAAPFTDDDLVALLLQEYDVDEPTARRDVSRLLQQYIDKGVVTI